MLPSWLVEDASYEPPSDRDAFLRKNVLSLASALALFRAGATPVEELNALDRWLARVPGWVRLLATIALVACVSVARNMAFVWVVLVLGLVVLALRPASQIKLVMVPALVGGGLALLVNIPALLLGQPSAPLRMAAKGLATVGLVANLAQALGSDGVVASLRACGLPAQAVTTIDLAIRDIVLLGESALRLSEALELRSVGKDNAKTSSVAGVMGITFVHAHRMATARAEAMELRGYGNMRQAPHGRGRMSWAVVGYVLVIALLAVAFAYLEVSLP